MDLPNVLGVLDNAREVLAKSAKNIDSETPRRMKMMLEFSAEEIRMGIPGFNKFCPDRDDVSIALESAARGAASLAMHFAGKTMPPSIEYPALSEVMNRWSRTTAMAINLMRKSNGLPPGDD